jgi:hypothetical protein
MQYLGVRQLAYTIDFLLSAMFPRGTRPKKGAKPNWSAIPIWAPDLFAFCATLVEQSGVYRHVPPSPIDHADDPFGLAAFVKHQDFHNLAAALSWGLAMFPDHASRSSTLWEQQKTYINNNLPNLDVQNSIKHDATHTQKYIAPNVIIAQDLSVFDQLWKMIVANSDAKITDDVESKANSWQSAALKLMVVSDQACSGIGFFPRGNAAPNWLQGMLLEVLR